MNKYGMEFNGSDLEIELWCIKAIEQGKWKSPISRFEHHKNAFTAAWPEDDHHRWSDICLRSAVNNDITVLLGGGDSGKTYLMSKFVLIDWWAFCDNTIWLVSSTELRGAELRIWGKIKELFNRARQRHPHLPGKVAESLHCITTEEISDDQSEGRLLTKGIMFLPCKRGGQWVGMGAMVGIKPTAGGRMGHAGDEVQAMQRVFLDAYSNWYGKPNFKGMMAGNPFSLEDPSCIAAEPVEGWQQWIDTGKTQEWTAKFYGAHAIALDGRDSPNLDYPADQKVKFPYLLGRKKMDAVKKFYGENDWHWWNQCVGKPRPGFNSNRVITIQLCEEGKAFESVVWKGGGITSIVGLDAAYGGIGGDRCVLQRIQFGKDVEDNDIIRCHPPVIVPVSVMEKKLKPEDQIALFCKTYCEMNAVDPFNFFFDGRGTLAISLARMFSPQVNAVEFGGPATSRNISKDIYTFDGDTKTKRLKRCDEEYYKFVTELWFMVRILIQCNQLRDLPREVAEEGSKREFKEAPAQRVQVEIKADMKERTGESPDMFDALVTAVEGARRRGFQISNLRDTDDDEDTALNWLAERSQKNKELFSSKQLVHR